MRRTSLYFILLLVAFALLVSLSACSSGSKPASPTQPVQSGASSTPSNPAAVSGQKSNAASAVPTSTGVPKPGGMPDIADIKTLPSYRLTIMTKMAEGSGAGLANYMKYEYVRDQKAEHAWMENANGKVTEVFIKIADKYWMWMGMAGMGWIEQPTQPAQTPSSTIPSDLVSQIKQAQQDVEHSKARFDKKGTETVNNVRCVRYEFEYNLTTEMPNLPTGGTTKTDMHSIGEVWIADQSGLSAVMIKSKSMTEITMAGKKTVMDSEQNLTDIGAAITIKPPEGAMQVPTAIPTVPTGIPTPPPTTKITPPPTTTTKTSPPPTTTTALPSATTTSVGGTLFFNDNFQGIWNSKWVWTDPHSDATYSFAAHAGFLRLTVPYENDLAGVANYDAPRLLIPQKDNFTLETLVEFDPQETYQGAGLLVWQDENTFLRLEFGFGGMGGGAKNVVFVKQEEGGLSLVNGIDLPDTLKRIELRLQRQGNQFKAWYRVGGVTWQEIGSTAIILNQAIDVGITQVTQYTSSVISADFDYFKVFTP